MQNQAAAQKLLEKLNHPDRHPKGRKYRGKGKQEDEVVFTLEEYENRRAQAKPSIKDKVLDISYDEDLAWKLQNEFNLEDSWVSNLISFSHEGYSWCFVYSFKFLPLQYLFQCLYVTCSGTKGFS